MPCRNLLPIKFLDELKAWCDAHNITHRPGKGDYQVIQIDVPQRGWQVVFSRADMKEHYSINEKLEPLVRQFLRERRETPNAEVREEQAFHDDPSLPF